VEAISLARTRPNAAEELPKFRLSSYGQYNADMNDAVIAQVYQRLRRAGVPATVPGSLPVTCFGDLWTARVGTVGLNPSWKEYLSKSRTELVGKNRHFETLGSLGAYERGELTDAQCERAITTMRGYFGPDKPVYSWFAGLSRVVEGFGVSFRDGSAAHLDLVQEPTDPVWSDVFKANRDAGAAMLNADLPFLRWQIEAFALSAVICTSRTVLDAVARITSAEVIETGTFAERRWTIARAELNGRAVAVVGWNIPLVRQPGLTRQEQTELGSVLRARVDAAGLRPESA